MGGGRGVRIGVARRGSQREKTVSTFTWTRDVLFGAPTHVARVGVPVCGCVDAASSELHCLFVREVPPVSLVKDTVGKCGSGADGEDVALETGAVGVYVEECGALCGAGWSGVG